MAAENWRRSFVSRVEEWSRSDAKNRTLVVLGGDFLLDWLLNKACSLDSVDQRTAERAVYHLLSDGDLFHAPCLSLYTQPHFQHILCCKLSILVEISPFLPSRQRWCWDIF